MIHYLKIKNFGPVRNEAEISFEVADGIQEDAYEVTMGDGRKLLKLAYIYGANASGKTTILNAFDFLRKILLHPAIDKAQELSFDPFLFCEDAYLKPSYFELSFYLKKIRYIYTLNFTKHSILDERLVFYQTVRPTELFSRQTNPEKRLAKIQFGAKVKVPARERDLLESNTLHNNTVLGAYAKTNVDIPELDALNKWFSTYLLGMVTSAHDLTELTAELIDSNPKIIDWINSLLYKADNQIVKVLNDTHPLSIQKESSGTKRYFGLGGQLYNLIHGSHFLCIDELETSLHPDLMKHFLQVFLMNSTRSQLLVTTHNLSLMADTDFIRRDALWFSEKESDGSVSLFSAADFDTTTLRKDASLINAYRTGKLGAKPNLGSPYIPPAE